MKQKQQIWQYERQKSSNSPKDDGNINDNKNSNTNDEYGNKPEVDKISVENESLVESNITINDINE